MEPKAISKYYNGCLLHIKALLTKSTNITHKKNSPDSESSYIFIRMFARGVSCTGITAAGEENENTKTISKMGNT